jgi:SAM-dependent methyltransferase
MAEFDDNDSTLGSNSSSPTTSLSPGILDFPKENGRTYHAYKAGKYLWPNDEEERNRLDLQHQLFKFTFNEKLFICPLDQKKGGIHRVLDVGTGTGFWAIEFGDQHPQAHVTGIDLSPIQPAWTPPNVQFKVGDLEEPWGFSDKLDFIYIRMMTGSFSHWPQIIEQCME